MLMPYTELGHIFCINLLPIIGDFFHHYHRHHYQSRPATLRLWILQAPMSTADY